MNIFPSENVRKSVEAFVRGGLGAFFRLVFGGGRLEGRVFRSAGRKGLLDERPVFVLVHHADEDLLVFRVFKMPGVPGPAGEAAVADARQERVFRPDLFHRPVPDFPVAGVDRRRRDRRLFFPGRGCGGRSGSIPSQAWSFAGSRPPRFRG